MNTKLLHIDLDCQIQPENHSLEVDGILTVSEVEDKVSFLLNPDLQWKQIMIKGKQKWVKVTPNKVSLPENSFLKTANLWEFEIPKANLIKKDNLVKIKVSYYGRILQADWDLNRLDEDFVELAMYGAWYPIPLEMNHHTYKLTLESPKGWTWVANGDRILPEGDPEGKTKWQWEHKQPGYDITLVGMPLEKAYSNQQSIFWGPKKIVEDKLFIEEKLIERKKALEEWLGPTETKGMFRYVFTPREKGGQYSRYQLVVTVRDLSKDPKKLPSLLQSMLHEISHQWWKKTPLKTYDNFLDEALAEYTSSLIVSERFGEEWLEQRINKVKEILEKQGELPAIRKTVRADKESYSLFYYRGFLLMRELHMKMGTEHFKKMVRAFAEKCARSKSITTQDFLATLKENSTHMKEDLVHIVNCWLDYSGKGVPSDC